MHAPGVRSTKALGPLDKRQKKTRCGQCAQRRIKCQGGFPCQFCFHNKRLCIPPKPQVQSGVVFVTHTARPQSSDESVEETRVISMLSRMPLDIRPDVTTQLIGHFFASFLVANDFSGKQSTDFEGLSLYQTSPSLYHAVIAVAALDATKRTALGTTEGMKAVEQVAFNSYRRSLIDLSFDLKEGRLIENDASLWSTFLLGIFELMYDVTGEGWVKHILYGTSKILQARGPQNCLFGHGRNFLHTARIFELCRSAIYVESTFLSEPGWVELMSRIREEYPESWHPREALLDILTGIVDLSHRAHELDQSDMTASADTLLDLVLEGQQLQGELQQWSSSVATWNAECPLIDVQSLLAQIYYHATCIFLSGIFDYRPYYSYLQTETPSLPESQIETHVSSILGLSSLALAKTYLSGALFFYPLRVAGARAKNSSDKRVLIRMLEDIMSRNFVVADAFIADLKGLWVS